MEDRTFYLSDLVGCFFGWLGQLVVVCIAFNGFFVLLRTFNVPFAALFVLVPLLGLLMKYGLVEDKGGLIGLLAKVTFVSFAIVGSIELILKIWPW